MTAVEGQNVVVVGAGASGSSAARLLHRKGAQVTVNEGRAVSPADSGPLGQAVAELREAGIQVLTGSHSEALLGQADLVVLSPGVPRQAWVDVLDARGCPVISEIELASWFIEATVVGVTGSNGKSTVTSLLGAMAAHDPRPHFVGGNIGTPLCEVVDTPAAREGGLVIVELSSFQLERVQRFRAEVAMILNLSPDHLDRYPDFQAYAAAKQRICLGQMPGDHLLIHDGDSGCEKLAEGQRAEVRRFGGVQGLVRLERDRIIDPVNRLDLPVDELCLVGDHNMTNACAAALAGRLAGMSVESIVAGLRAFGGLPHRTQFVAEYGGVSWYDDSKATNVGAAVAAVRGLARRFHRLVVIAGGKDKGGSYAPLVEVMTADARGLVLIGEASDIIARAFADSPYPVQRAEDMEQAVRLASLLACSGDAVVLAPACASFDQYNSYRQRGEVFQECVRAQIDSAADGSGGA